jgi:hypothetical protein
VRCGRGALQAAGCQQVRRSIAIVVPRPSTPPAAARISAGLQAITCRSADEAARGAGAGDVLKRGWQDTPDGAEMGAQATARGDFPAAPREALQACV